MGRGLNYTRSFAVLRNQRRPDNEVFCDDAFESGSRSVRNDCNKRLHARQAGRDVGITFCKQIL